jgi:hypothetical protein
VPDPFGSKTKPLRRRMLAPRTDRPKRRPLRYRGIALRSEKDRHALGRRRHNILEAVPGVLAVGLLTAAVDVHHEPGRTITFALGGLFACVYPLVPLRGRQRTRRSSALTAAAVSLLVLGAVVLLALVTRRMP